MFKIPWLDINLQNFNNSEFIKAVEMSTAKHVLLFQSNE